MLNAESGEVTPSPRPLHSAFLIRHSAFPHVPSPRLSPEYGGEGEIPMTDWRLGTMGFGYDDWSGPFYPRGVKSGDWLTFYARYFDAVELDTTFHAAPDAGRVRRGAAPVPDDFRFCAKAPRAVPHDLPPDRAADAM